jgi:hypothetical protein
MKFETFIENIKSPEGRAEIAEEMCHNKKCLNYEQTLAAINYLSLPMLLMFDKKDYLPSNDEIMDSLAERITQCGDSDG